MISTQIHHDETPSSNNNVTTEAIFEQELPDGEPIKSSEGDGSNVTDSEEANKIVWDESEVHKK